MSTDMEFDTIISLTIFDEYRKTFVSGYKKLSLPFTPYPGLIFDEENTLTAPVQNVSWSQERKSFRCNCEIEALVLNDGTYLDIDFYIGLAREAGYIGFDHVYKNEQG